MVAHLIEFAVATPTRSIMLHLDPAFRNIQMSWTKGDPAAFSAWMRLWVNARKWVG